MNTPGPFRAAPYPPTNILNLKRQTAKVLGLSKEARIRLEWVLWHQTHGTSQALTCRHFGIHRNTLTKWLKRFDEANIKTLEQRSRRPKQVRQRQASRVRDQKLIDLKREFPAWGREKIRVVYQARYQEPITAWYIQRAIKSYGLYCLGKPWQQRHSKLSYIKKKITELKVKPARTGFLLHLDTIVLHLQGVKRYILTGIDHSSRLSYAWVYKNHTSSSARDFLLRLRYLLKGRIENLHDQAARSLKFTHYWSRPRTPKDNAILERFNRTLKQEFLYQGNFHPNPQIMNAKLTS